MSTVVARGTAFQIRAGRIKLTSIKCLRFKRELLQIDVARHARIAGARLSEIENAHVTPPDDEIDRLARALGVSRQSLDDSANDEETVSA